MRVLSIRMKELRHTGLARAALFLVATLAAGAVVNPAQAMQAGSEAPGGQARPKIGLVLAALAAAGVYSVSAEDVSQQAVLNGTVVSVIEAGTPVKEGDVLVSVDSLVGGVPAARADRDGVVKEVRVQKGQTIAKQDVVAVLESK